MISYISRCHRFVDQAKGARAFFFFSKKIGVWGVGARGSWTGAGVRSGSLPFFLSLLFFNSHSPPQEMMSLEVREARKKKDSHWCSRSLKVVERWAGNLVWHQRSGFCEPADQELNCLNFLDKICRRPRDGTLVASPSSLAKPFLYSILRLIGVDVDRERPLLNGKRARMGKQGFFFGGGGFFEEMTAASLPHVLLPLLSRLTNSKVRWILDTFD